MNESQQTVVPVPNGEKDSRDLFRGLWVGKRLIGAVATAARVKDAPILFLLTHCLSRLPGET